MKLVDCIVIGGGPAGTFCASTLADKGVKCVLLEKRTAMRGKVCGGGISRPGVRVLEKIGFPVDLLLSKGVKITQRIAIIDGQTQVSPEWKDETAKAAFAIGLSRDALDEAFMQAAQSKGVEVAFGRRIGNLERTNGLFHADAYRAPKVVLAKGAGAIGGYKLPVGISALFSSASAEPGVFLFDHSACPEGYGWIFSIGQGLWNVGVWSRKPPPKLKSLFFGFAQTRVREFLGTNAVCVMPPKGAFIGAGEPVQSADPDVYVVGDAANCAQLSNGEGVPQAILSGIHAANSIVGELK